MEWRLLAHFMESLDQLARLILRAHMVSMDSTSPPQMGETVVRLRYAKRRVNRGLVLRMSNRRNSVIMQ